MLLNNYTSNYAHTIPAANAQRYFKGPLPFCLSFDRNTACVHVAINARASSDHATRQQSVSNVHSWLAYQAESQSRHNLGTHNCTLRTERSTTTKFTRIQSCKSIEHVWLPPQVAQTYQESQCGVGRERILSSYTDVNLSYTGRRKKSRLKAVYCCSHSLLATSFTWHVISQRLATFFGNSFQSVWQTQQGQRLRLRQPR